MRQKEYCGYNERLFSSGLRKRLHLARFHWLRKSMLDMRCPSGSVLELGCFDGKVIRFLPEKPVRYLGLDANWEGGLERAHALWNNKPHFEFRECHRPEEMLLNEEQFDMTVCMETFEHIPSNMVDTYLIRLAKATRQYIFITVPNEKGIIFLMKYVIKKVFHHDEYQYEPMEIVNATIGRMAHVARYEHKGFDYTAFIRHFSAYFTLLSVSGYPLTFLPPSLNFGIGIIGKPLCS